MVRIILVLTLIGTLFCSSATQNFFVWTFAIKTCLVLLFAWLTRWPCWRHFLDIEQRWDIETLQRITIDDAGRYEILKSLARPTADKIGSNG
jgi:hypothetical protein